MEKVESVIRKRTRPKKKEKPGASQGTTDPRNLLEDREPLCTRENTACSRKTPDSIKFHDGTRTNFNWFLKKDVDVGKKWKPLARKEQTERCDYCKVADKPLKSVLMFSA